MFSRREVASYVFSTSEKASVPVVKVGELCKLPVMSLKVCLEDTSASRNVKK